MYNKESYPCASYILGLSSIPYHDGDNDKGQMRQERQCNRPYSRVGHHYQRTSANTPSARCMISSQRKARIGLFVDGGGDTDVDSATQHDQQSGNSRAQQERGGSGSTLCARGDDLVEFEHVENVDINNQPSAHPSGTIKIFSGRCSQSHEPSSTRKHMGLASYDQETQERISSICNKLSQTFFDGTSDEGREHGHNDKNLDASLSLSSSSDLSSAQGVIPQEGQLYRKPLEEVQKTSYSETSITDISNVGVTHRIPRQGYQQRSTYQPHIVHPMDFLQPDSLPQGVVQEPVCNEGAVENEEDKPEPIPLNLLLEGHDRSTALLNEENENEQTTTNTQEHEDYTASSGSSEGEQPSQFNMDLSQIPLEFIKKASHDEVVTRIAYSGLSFEDRYIVIGHFVERLQQELYNDMASDARRCAEKIWGAGMIADMLYKYGVPYVRELMSGIMGKALLMPLYGTIGNGRDSSTLGHRYNTVTKSNIYSQGLPGEGITRAYFKPCVGQYARWKGTHLYQSLSLRRNSNGEEEIVDDNDEEDVLQRQESDAARESLEVLPPHEQERVFQVLRETSKIQKTLSDDALAYWANLLRPFGIDGDFAKKICCAPYEEQPEDVQNLLLECLTWAEKIDRIPFEYNWLREPPSAISHVRIPYPRAKRRVSKHINSAVPGFKQEKGKCTVRNAATYFSA